MPVFIISKNIYSERVGNDNPGDILEVFEGPDPPGGSGYEKLEITEISVISKATIENLLNSIMTITEIAKNGKEYWYDGKEKLWFELIIRPDNNLNLSQLTIQDKYVLLNSSFSSTEKLNVFNKIIKNIEQYELNYTILRPEDT